MRCIYAVVVLIKLFIAGKSPGEMGAVIKTDDLGVEGYIERMYSLFKSFMARDSNSPHSKFLYVMERLQTRFLELQRGDDGSSGAPRAGKPTLAQIAAGATGSAPDAHAQGLHLLSEAAMSGNPPPPPQPHPAQSWYAAGDMGAAQAGLGLDAAAYAQFPGDAMAAAAYDGLDYGLGGLGMASMGMDGAISGLFMADGLWNYNQAQGQVFPGSGWS